MTCKDGGERKSRESMLSACIEDDDDDEAQSELSGNKILIF